jgi:hypothetical protein
MEPVAGCFRPWEIGSMIAVLAAFLAAHQAAPSQGPADSGGTAWIVATLGHSEWCPAGNVRLDLEAGEYAFTPRTARRLCEQRGLDRPVSRGRLDAERLAAVREAYSRAVAEGLEVPGCRFGGPRETVIISNGGTPVLIVTNGAGTGAAPDDLTCWSEAAHALHDVLESAFDADDRP